VNTLCDTAMMAAYGEDRDQVTLREIEAALAELQWVEFAARVVARGAPEPAAHGDRVQKSLAKVVLSTEGKAVMELHLVPGRKVIGRTPDNDLQIDSKFISRHHCQLVTGSDGLTVIEDLNSTNGLVIRGKRVRRHTLRDGDLVEVGQHQLLYVDDQAAHLADTQDELPRVNANAANEDAGDENEQADDGREEALGGS
jgi:general secretion pathway protein A